MNFSPIKAQAMVLSATVLLGGCGHMYSGNYSLEESKRTAKQCCDSLSSLPFKQLPADRKVRLSIDRDDAIYHYAEDQSSFVEALVLPLNSRGSILEIESELILDDNSPSKHIFYPVLTFLDQNKQVIEMVDSTEVSLHEPLFTRDHMRIVVRLNGELSHARYVLIHTTEDKLNYSISKGEANQLLQTDGFDTMIYAPISKPRYRINFGAEGWIKIRVTSV